MRKRYNLVDGISRHTVQVLLLTSICCLCRIKFKKEKRKKRLIVSFWAGISKIMDSNISIIRQQGDVELEIYNMVEKLSWSTVIRQSLE